MGGLCLPKSDSLPFGVAAMALRTAMGTVAAAGGFPLPLLADQGKGNEGDNGDKYNRNQNRREVRANPAEHGKSLLCVCEFWKGSGLERGGFLVGTHQHVDDAGQCQDRADEADHVQVAREGAAELVDHQADQVSEAALIADGEPRPLLAVHLALDGADGREARCAPGSCNR